MGLGDLRVLGVDPGSLVTGWGLIGGSPSRPTLIDCGVVRLAADLPLPHRLAKLQSALRETVASTRPSVAAVETPFHGASPRSALILAHARGAILATLATAEVPVVEYAPAAVKRAVAGNGRADKSQVARLVAILLDRAPPQNAAHDLTDALAVALCHVATATFARAVAHALDA